MAYVSKDLKARLSVKIKEVCKKYGVSATVAIRNHSTLQLNVKSGKIDFMQNYRDVLTEFYDGSISRASADNYISVNEYRIDEHFSGVAREFLREVKVAMNDGNFDYSDTQTDYFHIGWYTQINIGKWDKPYELKV